MHSGHLPEPIANAVTRLASGENVTAEEFEESLKKYLS